MKPQIKYIELKSGYSDNGPAWIGKVEFSKSGKSVYFNGHAFKGNGHGGCTDLESREIYWITGIKKDGQNRHWAGTGKIMIDKDVVSEYLKLIDSETLDLNKFEVIEIMKTDKSRFVDIENETLDDITIKGKFPDLNKMSIDELKTIIRSLKRREYYTNPINGRKFITIKIQEAEKILNNLLTEKE